MELTKQVVSLELAKRLKELGVKQEGLYSWSWAVPSRGESPEERLVLDKQTVPELYSSSTDWGDCFDTAHAFTVAELGEMLPWDIVIHRDINKGWHITFQANGMTEKEMKFSEDANEADARAKMLIYLLENNLTSSQETNI